jgi:hypothetical protein
MMALNTDVENLKPAFLAGSMLSDPHHRINTTSFVHGKPGPYQWRGRAQDFGAPEPIRYRKPSCFTARILFFHDTGYALASLRRRPALARYLGERYQ